MTFDGDVCSSAERVGFKRRLDITYGSETAVQALAQSANICLERFDLVCVNDSYVGHLGNYVADCRCKTFVRQTVKTFRSGSQSQTSDSSKDSSDNGYKIETEYVYQNIAHR